MAKPKGHNMRVTNLKIRDFTSGIKCSLSCLLALVNILIPFHFASDSNKSQSVSTPQS